MGAAEAEKTESPNEHYGRGRFLRFGTPRCANGKGFREQSGTRMSARTSPATHYYNTLAEIPPDGRMGLFDEVAGRDGSPAAHYSLVRSLCCVRFPTQLLECHQPHRAPERALSITTRIERLGKPVRVACRRHGRNKAARRQCRSPRANCEPDAAWDPVLWRPCHCESQGRRLRDRSLDCLEDLHLRNLGRTPLTYMAGFKHLEGALKAEFDGTGAGGTTRDHIQIAAENRQCRIFRMEPS